MPDSTLVLLETLETCGKTKILPFGKSPFLFVLECLSVKHKHKVCVKLTCCLPTRLILNITLIRKTHECKTVGGRLHHCPDCNSRELQWPICLTHKGCVMIIIITTCSINPTTTKVYVRESKTFPAHESRVCRKIT